MKIVVAEKISAAAVDLLREPRWVVVTPDNMEGGLAQQLESADALIVRSAVQVNAELQTVATSLGSVTFLTPGEAESTMVSVEGQLNRAWDLWSMIARSRQLR